MPKTESPEKGAPAPVQSETTELHEASEKAAGSKALTPRPVTLEVLDAMPTTSAHQSLKEMSDGQLQAMSQGLHRMRERCDSMSGVCAVLAGSVLEEIKERVGHGGWEKWLKDNFAKGLTMAKVYRRLWKAFSKSAPQCRFDQMTLALMDGAQPLDSQSLDMTHPVVSAVAKWTKGRTFNQLREEELRTGGNHHPECIHCGGDLASKDQETCPHCGQPTGEKEPTPEEQAEELKSQMREWAAEHLSDDRAEKKLWRLLPDHEAEALAAHFLRLGREINEWVKTPAKRREEMSVEEVLG